MADLGFHLSQALTRGRKHGGKPRSREEVLYRLLHKRAAASREGLDEQEAVLRDQIRWALPMHRIDEFSDD